MTTRRDALKLGAAAALASTTPAALSAGTGGRLLVLGGTSFIGPHLTDQALARGWQVTHFNRGKRKPEGYSGVETLHGDRDGQLDALRGRKWDVVVDTSGYVPRHVKLSAELLADSVELYVFISTISVYASFATPNDETSRLAELEDPTTEKVDGETYGGLKVLCEFAADSAMSRRTLTVRPGLIVGPLDPTDRFTYWPARVARGGEVLAPGSPADPIQVIDVRDLAGWTMDMVERRTRGVYNAVSPPGMFTMGGLLGDCKRAAGGGVQLTWVPAEFLATQKVEPWSDMPVWIPPTGDEAAGALTSVARALQQGMKIRPLFDTVRDTLAWHQSRPEDRRSKLRAGLSAEREAEVLKAWRASQNIMTPPGKTP
jgi:2'-hydroxyisoflavone reductase